MEFVIIVMIVEMFDVNGFQVQQIDDVMVVGQQIKQVSSL
jgi:hypothetical protein